MTGRDDRLDRLLGAIAGTTAGHALEARTAADHTGRHAERRLRDSAPNGSDLAELAEQLDELAQSLREASGLAADLLAQVSQHGPTARW